MQLIGDMALRVKDILRRRTVARRFTDKYANCPDAGHFTQFL